MSDDQEKFDEAVRELARQDGVEVLLSIPGIWEIVSEYYNNDAIARMRADENEPEEIEAPSERHLTRTPTEREVEFDIATQPEPKTRPIAKPSNTDE